MENKVIEVSDISKQYRLGQVSAKTIAADIKRWSYRVRGKEDPFLKIGEENDRSTKGISEYVWALRDINFDVKQGEVLGIIGKNGAGKSTLLKLLSRVTTPSTGLIKIKGRMAALLEVGTGFHPELTGRENVFLNGAIMGMSKSEIKSKFDEIVDFSGVERYIDTPVKRYSSGMHVRLGFAVAAHLEPEILVIDEVLAVGDIDFQKKCLGKMKSVSGDGRTVLFVSHNLSAINSLCTRAILLSNGRLIDEGETEKVVRNYKLQNTVNSINYENNEQKNGIVKVHINTSTKTEVHEYGKELTIDIEAVFNKSYKDLAIAIQIVDENEKSIINPLALTSKIKWVKDNKGEISCILKSPRLYQGKYSITIHIGDKTTNEHIQTLENACAFEVNMDNLYSEYGWAKNAAVYMEDYTWKTKNEIYEVNF